jgi:UDP-N-acetylmuramoyl-L-alanyl-D-glutamate--2,6-diaminopimelate ligase
MTSRVDDLLAALAQRNVTVRELSADSRTVHAGDVFVAYPGAAADGRRFIGQAVARGAAAVLWEREGFEWETSWQVPNVAVPALRAAVGPLAHRVYGRATERLWVVGVTGTNGKTSTSQWIAQALNASGRRTAIVGTLGLGFRETLEPNPNTTPDAIVLAKAFARFEHEGARAVSMEVSSIGLDQGRVAGVAFDCAVFTNLSRDHLDYHPDMASYAAAKAKLFDWATLTHVVTNLDDALGVRIGAQVAGRRVARIGYTLQPEAGRRAGLETFLEAHDIRHDRTGLAFDVVASQGQGRIDSRMVGRFNVSNLLAVVGALLAAGVSFEEALQRVAALEPVPGRMERIGGGALPSVIVDYAHSPDALEKVLVAARELAQGGGGRLIAVFGCGGQRDRGKRPLMGQVASRFADSVVVTSDNPRHEDPAAIIADILGGIDTAKPHSVVADRAEAIRSAVSQTRPGDVIVLAGKGHEPYQEIAGVRRPFSDANEARKALIGC